MLECGWPRHRCEQRLALHSDASASRALAGPQDGSLGKASDAKVSIKPRV